MSVLKSELTIRGRSVPVPMARIDGRDVIVVGRWLRTAMFKDEEWLEGESVENPAQFLERLRASGLRADLLTFTGRLDSPPIDDTRLLRELENAAVIRTNDYKAWWDGLPQEARKNTRRATKKGIEIRSAKFDDALVAGIKVIYDEAAVRQGRPFWHYGKDLETIERENGTYLDRCEFLGAYFSGELVGFMKWVYVDHAARIMQILCLNAHQDKRPMIALIARAAEICHQRGMKYLIYGKFTYGRKTGSSITEFKRRLGFEKLEFSRYYVTLSLQGRFAVRIGAHRGWLEVFPAKLLYVLGKMRSWWLERTVSQGRLTSAATVTDADASSRKSTASVGSEVDKV